MLSVNGQDVTGTLTATLTDADGLNDVVVTFGVFDQNNNQLGNMVVGGSGNDANFSFLVPNNVNVDNILRVEASYTDAVNIKHQF